MGMEAAHKSGMDGVQAARRWLEATTHLNLQFDAYDHTVICQTACLDGKRKTFDLFGGFLTGDKAPVYVEVKHVKTESGLRAKYERFLATAYSATVQNSFNAHFMWVSWHPFGPMDKWNSMESVTAINDALAKNKDLLGNHSIDANVVADVAGRIWNLTLSEKQDKLALEPQDILKVWSVLNRKE